MDTHRFDSVTRTLTNGLTRRTALAAGASGLAASALAGLGLRRAAAQDSTPVASPAATGAGFGQEFLFVQTAEAGTWMPKSGEEGVYTLTLTGAAAQTIYFSDRPDRIVGTAPMQQFLDNLGFTPDNPPNAAMVTGTGDAEEVLIIELYNPTYDAEADTLTYEARVLEDYDEDGLAFVAQRQGDTDLPSSFGHTSLFIDDCPDARYCGNAGLRDVPVPECDIPGGPYGRCWHWSSLSCSLCNTSLDHLRQLCLDSCQVPESDLVIM